MVVSRPPGPANWTRASIRLSVERPRTSARPPRSEQFLEAQRDPVVHGGGDGVVARAVFEPTPVAVDVDLQEHVVAAGDEQVERRYLDAPVPGQGQQAVRE